MPKIIAINRTARIGGKPATGEQFPDWRAAWLHNAGGQWVFKAFFILADGQVHKREAGFPVNMPETAILECVEEILAKLHKITDYQTAGTAISRCRKTWVARHYAERLM